MDNNQSHRKLGELAFEHEFGDGAESLWRVSLLRKHNDRKIRIVDWFRSDKAAQEHVDRRVDLGDELLLMSHYALVK